jgi:hypothetical protein
VVVDVVPLVFDEVDELVVDEKVVVVLAQLVLVV